MNIVIKSVDFQASNALETFVKEKVGKLFKLSNNIIRANVILRKGENNSIENKQCQITLMIPGNDHIVKRKAGLYEKSVLQAVEVLQKNFKKKEN